MITAISDLAYTEGNPRTKARGCCEVDFEEMSATDCRNGERRRIRRFVRLSPREDVPRDRVWLHWSRALERWAALPDETRREIDKAVSAGHTKVLYCLQVETCCHRAGVTKSYEYDLHAMRETDITNGQGRSIRRIVISPPDPGHMWVNLSPIAKRWRSFRDDLSDLLDEARSTGHSKVFYSLKFVKSLDCARERTSSVYEFDFDRMTSRDSDSGIVRDFEQSACRSCGVGSTGL